MNHRYHHLYLATHDAQSTQVRVSSPHHAHVVKHSKITSTVSDTTCLRMSTRIWVFCPTLVVLLALWCRLDFGTACCVPCSVLVVHKTLHRPSNMRHNDAFACLWSTVYLGHIHQAQKLPVYDRHGTTEQQTYLLTCLQLWAAGDSKISIDLKNGFKRRLSHCCYW